MVPGRKEGLIVVGSVEVEGGGREGDCGEEVRVLGDDGFGAVSVIEGEEFVEDGGREEGRDPVCVVVRCGNDVFVGGLVLGDDVLQVL